MAFDIQKAGETLKKRRERREAMRRELAEVAQKDADRIVKMLIEQFRPRKIYQWGSLLHHSRFREYSDIDIAVEGLKGPLDGLRAIDEASSLTQFPVDIVELERIHPAHARSIRDEGRLIYEQ